MHRFKGQAQSLTQVIANGLALFWASLSHVWYLALALGLCSVITSELYMFQISKTFTSSFQYGTLPPFKSTFIKYVIFAVIYFILLLIKSFITGIMFHRMFLIGSGVQGKLMDSVHFVLGKIFPLAVTYILCNAIILTGFMAFIVPGLFFSVMLIFVTPLIILDDHTIVESFQYSWLLVWKSWWRTFSIVIIPIGLSLAGITAFFFKSPPFFVQILDIIRMTLVSPLLAALILIGFYDAKIRHHVALNLKKPLHIN